MYIIFYYVSTFFNVWLHLVFPLVCRQISERYNPAYCLYYTYCLSGRQNYAQAAYNYGTRDIEILCVMREKPNIEIRHVNSPCMCQE